MAEFDLSATGQRIGKPFFEKGTDSYKEDIASRRGGFKTSRRQDRTGIEANFDTQSNEPGGSPCDHRDSRSGHNCGHLTLGRTWLQP